MLHAMLRAAAGTRTYDAEVLADNPVAYWRLGDTAGPYVDEIGTADLIVSGNPNEGATGAINGDIDTAISFDGTDDFAQYDIAAWTGNFTVELWAKSNANGQTQYSSAFASASDTLINSFQIDLNGSNSWGFTGTDDGGTNVLSVVFGAAPTDAFVHLVAVCDGVDTSLYYNGAFVLSLTVSFTTGKFVNYIFGRNRSGNNYANAVIDEAAIYDFALSPARIEAHYNAGTA